MFAIYKSVVAHTVQVICPKCKALNSHIWHQDMEYPEGSVEGSARKCGGCGVSYMVKWRYA